jgi:hypothetical protein
VLRNSVDRPRRQPDANQAPEADHVVAFDCDLDDKDQ